MDFKLKNHLSALAELRNIAARKGQIAAAVAAEVARGRALGLYQREQGDTEAEFIEVFREIMERMPN